MKLPRQHWILRGMSLFVIAVGCFGLFLRLSDYQQSQRDTRLVAAIHHGETEEALAALKEGANPNARGYLSPLPEGTETIPDSLPESSKFPALMIAADNGNPTLLKALLDKGADVNERMGPTSGARGYTALIYAVCRSRDPEMVQILLAHGADFHGVTEDGKTPLSAAESFHHDKVAMVLKQAGEEE